METADTRHKFLLTVVLKLETAELGQKPQGQHGLNVTYFGSGALYFLHVDDDDNSAGFGVQGTGARTTWRTFLMHCAGMADFALQPQP